MHTSTVELNDKIYFVNYEFIEGEESDWDYQGTNPMAIIHKITDDNFTEVYLSNEDRFEIENEIYNLNEH